MLSLGKLAPGQQQYYLDTVAKGAEEYYTGAKEAPGEWRGAAPRVSACTVRSTPRRWRMSSRTTIPSPASTSPSAARTPRSPASTRPSRHPSPCRCCSPSAIRKPRTRSATRTTPRSTDAFAFLEERASVGRRGRGGIVHVDGDGFVAAAFRHRTSRAAEPQLHTHVVIANLVHSPTDDRWTALDGRPLYRWSRPVGHLYEAQLRWELTRRLGVGWGPVRNGIADIAGVPTAAIEAFSTRRHQILEHLDAHGETGGRAAQIAAYATRIAKDTSATPESLVDGWRSKAAAHGLDDRVLDLTLDRRTLEGPPKIGSDQAEELCQRLAAPDGLTLRRSTLGRGDVIEAICDRLPDGGRVADIVALTDAFLDSPHVIALHTRTEQSVDDHGERWTTPEMLATEARLLELVDQTHGARAGMARHEALMTALASRPTLDDEQEAMVRHLCGSGAGIEAVEGVAGAGKTFALGVASDAWTATGYRVRGACLAARAAQRLEEGSGIPSSTIDRLERSLRRDPLAPFDVVVVDEAGMVGTRALLRLAEQATLARAKLVLIGDPRQLPELEAGGAFASFTNLHEAARLGTNRRQADAWERNALAELRHGDPDAALDAYLQWGRVHHHDDVREEIVNAWLASRMAGDDALMVAAHLRAVDDLNARARARLRETGLLGPDVVRLGGRGYAVGDEILTLRNDYDLGYLNGMRGVIREIDAHSCRLIVDMELRDGIELPFTHVIAGAVTHGYATTIHKAQGATVDRCFVLIDETMSREHTYTALSRGRLSNELYVDSLIDRFDEPHATEVTPDELDRLRRNLGRSISQELAIEQLGLEPRAAPELEIDDGLGW